MENISQMSLLEVAIYLMEKKKTQQNIKLLMKETLEMKGLEDLDGSLTTQLYIDITTSSKFVYMGDGEWDLKIRQSLDEFDKDGSAFNSKDELFEEEEKDIQNIEIEEYNDDDDDDDYSYEYDDDDDDDSYEYDDDENDDDSYEYEEDDDYIGDDILDEAEVYSEDDFNEDKYNDLMDDYEDMYE